MSSLNLNTIPSLHDRIRHLLTVAFVAMLLGLAMNVANAADHTAWSAGAAEIKITPGESVWMAGYAARTKPSEKVLQDLYAKALVIQDGNEQTLVKVTLDLISVPGPLREFVEEHLQSARGLGPASLLMNCSHTHSGPEIRMTGSALAGLPPERQEKSIAYVEQLRANILHIIDEAFAAMAPAKLTYHKARAGFAMNRRLWRDGRYINHPNPDGRVDHDVPVLKVEGAEGMLLALVFGYACHNTTLGTYEINGDYAGYAQEYIAAAHPGTVTMFMMGCGGDQNPYPRRTVEWAQAHGRNLATAVEAALETEAVPLTGSLALGFKKVELDYAEAPTDADLEAMAQSSSKYDRRYAERLQREIEQGTLIRSYPAPVQVIRIGNELLFVALPGETVVDYSLRIKRENRGENAPEVWVAGYSNDVFAYIPSERVLLEGGYEAGGAMRYMTTVVQPGPFAPDVEKRLMEAVDSLIEQTAP